MITYVARFAEIGWLDSAGYERGGCCFWGHLRRDWLERRSVHVRFARKAEQSIGICFSGPLRVDGVATDPHSTQASAVAGSTAQLAASTATGAGNQAGNESGARAGLANLE
jgi:hypothetical protein